jgi:hypothetical protein
MSTDYVAPFHGDKEDENPGDFLRSFYRRMGSSSDDVKKQQFQNFLQSDGAADEWFDDLPQGDKKDWSAIEIAFHKRWPRKKVAKRTTEEYEEDIMTLRLRIEDLGKKEKVTGRDVHSHIAWADKMAVIVKGAKLETTTTYIGHVRKELPKLLREKVGTGHADWTTFLQAVRHQQNTFLLITTLPTFRYLEILSSLVAHHVSLSEHCVKRTTSVQVLKVLNKYVQLLKST